MRNPYIFLAVAVVLGAVAMQSSALRDFSSAHLPAGLFIEKGAEPEELKSLYGKRPIRIMIVAGHDAEFSGAVYRGLVEADLTLELASRLFQLFFADKKFLASRSRTAYGYTTDLAAMFRSAEGQTEIAAFREKARALMQEARNEGEITRNVAVHHPAASNDISSRLYGINRWANMHDADIVLHVHFNDYPGRPKGAPGRYSGMSLYIPERQLPNAPASRMLAEDIHAALASFMAPSNFPPEQDGIVEDQELIAIGSNGSLKSAAVLMEYGYIYEPQLQTPEVREVFLNEMAFQTYRGVKKFFDPGYDGPAGLHGSALLPYRWERPMRSGMRGSADIFVLQIALAREGLYPPEGTTLTECPIVGSFGPCTARAVRAFQERYAQEIARAAVGEEMDGEMSNGTLTVLAARYGR